MNDRNTFITLMVVFAGIGVVILALGWTRTMTNAEHVITSLIGSAGIIGTLIRILMLRAKRRATVATVAEVTTD